MARNFKCFSFAYKSKLIFQFSLNKSLYRVCAIRVASQIGRSLAGDGCVTAFISSSLLACPQHLHLSLLLTHAANPSVQWFYFWQLTKSRNQRQRGRKESRKAEWNRSRKNGILGGAPHSQQWNISPSTLALRVSATWSSQWESWTKETILYGSLMFLHILWTEALTTFVHTNFSRMFV